MAGKASIKDVARLAGVSTGTVSNVFNNPQRVSADTAERVNRAVAMLDYYPNSNARSLVEGASRNIGLLLPDLGNSFFADISRGAESAAEDAGYDLMIANTDARLEREERYLRTFIQDRSAGLLMTLTDDVHYVTISRHERHRLPTVVVNLDVPRDKACSVTSDNDLGGWMAASHLADLGRARLAYVGGPATFRPITRRSAGFDRAVRQRGLRHVRTINPSGVGRTDGWTAGQALVDDVRAGRIDGIFAATDLLAAGVVQALTSAGIQIPDDAAVIGYDNNRAAWDSPLPISTIAQPGEAIGQSAMRLLLEEIINDAGFEPQHHHESVLLKPSLVVRASSVGA